MVKFYILFYFYKTVYKDCWQRFGRNVQNLMYTQDLAIYNTN
jgi:hypothetical protein